MEKSKVNRLFCSGYWLLIYFTVLFTALLLFYLPSFTNPPHVDYWEAFYTFHRADASPSPGSWVIILNHDPWQDGTFRPFSYLLLYLTHKVFGADFIGNHIFNFIIYCLVIMLLYCLARQLGLDGFLTGAFLAVYTFLFSHSDILSLTFHLFVIMSFSAFLLGFILYLKFMATGKRILLIPISLLFLFGMYCYEVYILWPLAVIILSHIPRGSEFPRFPREKTPGVVWLMLGMVYIFYSAGFLLSRSVGQISGPLPEPVVSMVFSSFCSICFNLFYNGILINLMPFLAWSGRLGYWAEMGRVWKAGIPISLPSLITWVGVMMIIILALGGWILYRRRQLRVLSLLAFFFFLYLCSFFVLSLGRVTNSNFGHLLVQFRYQFIPNALFIMMVLAVVDGLCRPGRKRRLITAFCLTPILIVNICISHKNIMMVRENLRPLRLLLAELKEGIRTGVINKEDRIYIQPGITSYLPPLCWHKGVGKFIEEGTYEWYFPEGNINCFVFSREEAVWILDQPIGGYRKLSVMDE